MSDISGDDVGNSKDRRTWSMGNTGSLLRMNKDSKGAWAGVTLTDASSNRGQNQSLWLKHTSVGSSQPKKCHCSDNMGLLYI